jgi:hypothetical protein
MAVALQLLLPLSFRLSISRARLQRSRWLDGIWSSGVRWSLARMLRPSSFVYMSEVSPTVLVWKINPSAV